MEILSNKKEFLEVKSLSKSYNGKKVLNEISFVANKGEFISILGPSGCGKTTLLNILIGIIKPDNGAVLKEGIDITNVPSSKRQMGIVFQNYSLFPNMTALKNVEYALTLKKESKKDARIIAENLLKKVGLEDHFNKKPNKLSGGQQQRVAIARTLALNPKIILFDEPMSALDITTRLALRDYIKEIQLEYNITIIYITHDQEEAFAMSDKIIVMSEGNIEQIDSPCNIIHNASNKYVEDFVVKQLNKKINALTKFVG